MRDYETTFILAPTLDGAGVREQVDEIKKTIASLGGEVHTDKEWGRRRLAYPIEDHSEGVYHVLRFHMEGSKLRELDRYFRHHENVLRALVIQNENSPLEYLGQSESEEHGSRDDHGPRSREDRGRGREPRSRERATAAAPAPGSGAGASATATEAAPGSAAGGEEKSE